MNLKVLKLKKKRIEMEKKIQIFEIIYFLNFDCI